MPSAVTTRGSAAPSSLAGPGRERKTTVLPGDVIGGRYIVEEVLGTGGMGIVVAARHEALGHRVAMKLVSTSTTADENAFVRFSREARIIASLESDHVVRIVDYGMHAGTPYMVMELLAGRDLGCELKMRGPMPIEEVCDYVIQACDGLSVAHAKGIVHRDVKLANLFASMRADGERVIKVLDFGVSKLQVDAQEDMQLTRTTSMLGSPLYMSPEQIRDPRAVDARADIWSLGIVLYKLVTNESPFTGLNANAVCAAIAADPPATFIARASHLPKGFAGVVLRCLEKQPDHRYENVAALARQLAPYASSRGKAVADQLVARAISDGLLRPADEPTPPEETASTFDLDAPTILERSRPRRGPSTLAWLGAGVAVVASVALAVVFRTGSASSSSVTPLPLPTSVARTAAAKDAIEPPTELDPAPQPTHASAPPMIRHAITHKRLAAATIKSPVTRRPTAAPTTHFGGSALDDHN